MAKNVKVVKVSADAKPVKSSENVLDGLEQKVKRLMDNYLNNSSKGSNGVWEKEHGNWSPVPVYQWLKTKGNVNEQDYPVAKIEVGLMLMAQTWSNHDKASRVPLWLTDLEVEKRKVSSKVLYKALEDEWPYLKGSFGF